MIIASNSVGNARRRHGATTLSVAKNSHAIGDLPNLGQPGVM